MSVLGVLIFLSILFFALSWGIHAYVNEHGESGVDHWYWLCYRDAMRQKKKFPPTLPNYLMDEDQAYPPIFPLFFSILPDTLFSLLRKSMPLMINFLRLLLLLGTLHLLQVTQPSVFLICGILYLTTPLIASYNTQLNPRGLGALLMDTLWVWLMFVPAGPVLHWSVATGLMCLILLTHKMTTQLAVSVLLVMGVLLKRWDFIALVPLSVLLTTLLTGGFYLRMLKAHKHIVWYWSEYWPLIGADPLKESRLYALPGYTSPTRQFVAGWKNFIKRFLSIFLGNYAPVVLGALVACLFMPLEGARVPYLLSWLGASVLFAILTIMIPILRGLGFGNLYLYNAAFPAGLLLGKAAETLPQGFLWIAAGVFVMNTALLVRSLIQRRNYPGWVIPKEVVDAVSKTGPGSWLCIPIQWMEHLAYLCNKPVLWGGHAGSMEPLKQVFPVIQASITELKQKYNLRYLLVDESHLKDVERFELPTTLRFSCKGVHILELT